MHPLQNLRVSKAVIAVLLMTITATVLTTVTVNSVMIPTRVPDQPQHMRFAIDMLEDGVPGIPHFLYHLMVIAVFRITGAVNWQMSAVITNLLSQGLTIVLAFFALVRVFKVRSFKFSRTIILYVVCAVLAFGFGVMAPVFPLKWLFGPETNPLLLGYVTPIVYHNPTIIVLRPFALILFLFIDNYVLGESDTVQKRTLYLFPIGMIVTVLSGLAKPNYLIVVLPALTLWIAWSLLRRYPVNWQLGTLGILLPAILFLVWQFYFTYINPTEQLANTGIMLAPFKEVFYLSGGSRGMMLVRFGASVLFPVVVYVISWRSARQENDLNFAWLSFAIGIAYMYLIAESGERQGHGNFFWSAYISIFILNFVSLRFALKEWLKLLHGNDALTLSWQFVLQMSAFALSVTSGLLYIAMTNTWLLSHL